jgi:cytochrome oxidase Cu insertion factor (SCO1/SenC/PrrC family)
MTVLKTVRWLAIGAILGLGAAWGFHFWREARLPDPTSLAGSAIGGPFELLDQTGATRRDDEFRGRYMLVYFGFTFCPDACPTALLAMAEALDLVGPLAARVQPILISVDPDRDTPAQLASYVAAVDERLIGLTGTQAQIAAAARAYRVFYRKVTPPGMNDYLVDHTSLIYLMDPDGRFVAHFNHETPPERMAETLRRLVR